jgi:hypothetical protein
MATTVFVPRGTRGWVRPALYRVTAVERRGRPRSQRFTYADDRRLFGTVGTAIIGVLVEAREPMRPYTIHEAVQAKLGGTVSPNTVRDYLRRRAKGANALLEPPAYGRYGLRRA